MYYKNKTQKINELKAELESLKKCKPKLLSTSVEEVDDIYQQMLEWNYEYEAINAEIQSIRGMSYVDFDARYNHVIEDDLVDEPKHGDEWMLEDGNC